VPAAQSDFPLPNNPLYDKICEVDAAFRGGGA
jgi:hypothetical protein